METFSDLLVEHIPCLRRYARALTGDVLQAEELVQDCLDRAWGRMAQWEPGTNFRAWLFTIMHNQYVNALRRNSRQNGWESLDTRDPADTRRTGQDSAMDLRDLEKGLAQLSADQREVLVLVCVEGMSYEQVAAVLGVATGTVMSRLHRGREKLRRWMSGEHGERPTLRRVK